MDEERLAIGFVRGPPAFSGAYRQKTAEGLGDECCLDAAPNSTHRL
jgi:hypothetical protein